MEYTQELLNLIIEQFQMSRIFFYSHTTLTFSQTLELKIGACILNEETESDQYG